MKAHPPFSQPAENNKIVETRIKKTISLLTDQKLESPYLDIGKRSLATEYLEAAYGSVYSTRDSDFNYYVDVMTAKRFNTIFCLEVLEHVMNCLSFMNNLRDLLTMTGRIVLTTPTTKLWVEANHFSEYQEESLKTLFNYANFQIHYHKIFRAFPALFYLTGIRPLFYRLPFHRYHLFILGQKEYGANYTLGY